MKTLVSHAIVFLILSVVCRPVAAQDRGEVIALAKMPKAVVAGAGKVTLFVDWANVKEIKRKGEVLPWHSTKMYTVNQSKQPITIRRTTYYDGNSALEYRNKNKKWQRTSARFIQWGACGTGQWTKDFRLLPGQCFVENVLLQKFGKMETVRYRLVADGKNYYSNAHTLRLYVNPQWANAADQDDWAITYGTLDLLRNIVSGKIKFARLPNRFVKEGVSQSKMLALQSLAKPWHPASKTLPILDGVIKSGDKHHAPIALAAKKQISTRQAKSKTSK